MKTIYTLVLVFFTLSAFNQNKNLQQMTAKADSAQIARIINCLSSYSSERTLGTIMTVAGAGMTGLYLSIANSTDPKDASNKKITPILAGAFILGGVIIFIDADKWLSKRKLTFTGDKLAYRF